MFREEFEEERFEVNRGRDAFVDKILSIPGEVTENYIKYVYEVLGDE